LLTLDRRERQRFPALRLWILEGRRASAYVAFPCPAMGHKVEKEKERQLTYSAKKKGKVGSKRFVRSLYVQDVRSGSASTEGQGRNFFISRSLGRGKEEGARRANS